MTDWKSDNYLTRLSLDNLQQTIKYSQAELPYRKLRDISSSLDKGRVIYSWDKGEGMGVFRDGGVAEGAWQL